MGITVTPHELDDESGTSRLSVSYSHGVFDTPLRFVNRNDLNAKSTIGADVQLTSDRQPFVFEQWIDPAAVNGILNTNGFLGQFVTHVDSTLSRVDPHSFRVVYPRLTEGAVRLLEANPAHRVRVAKFLLDVMTELPADAYALQDDLLGDKEWTYLESQSRQAIPVVEIGNLNAVTEALTRVPKRGASVAPFVAFTYSSYPRANLSYERILSARRLLHEKGIGVMILGATRVIGGVDRDVHDLSAPHYSSFLIADVVGQRYWGGGGKPLRKTRVFEKVDLAAPSVTPSHNASEHAGEDAAFLGDPKLKDLFWRTMQAQNTDEDWRKSRAPAMSRLHEILVSSGEYGAMRQFITSGELKEYRREKTRLASLLDRERPLA